MKHKFALLISLLFASACLPCPASEPFPGISGDKTLVVWASPANLTQRGGSALTIDDGESHFDGIVFGEIAAAKWMAGSDFYSRTRREQDAVPAETAGPDTMVQIAIVNRDNEVTIYRNGQLYSRHEIQSPQRFGSNSAVVIGLRHLQAQDGACFAGAIDDARIYNVALTAEQIGDLRANQLSEPEPVAWWNFESGKAEDVLGAFPPGKLIGKARIDAGKLMLDGVDSYLVTPPTVSAKPQAVTSPDVAKALTLNYHLMHPGGASLPGDPNAAFCLDGVYHLHYILAHPWRAKRSFSFVHVTSNDMLHWTWKSTKLQPSFTGHGMFSGTGFLTREGRPAAIYHGQGSGRNQIAIAKDRQISAWEKPYAVDVRNADGTEAKIAHWDPDCFLIGDTYYAISGGEQPPLFKSHDLKNWTYVGPFLQHDMPDVAYGEDVSCPNFFRIGDKWMLLCISHPLGCRYYLGDWDAKAEQFVPEQHVRVNWRRDDQSLFGRPPWRVDFFAPESLLTTDGRRVMWAWLATIGSTNGNMDNRTIQSLPRELSLSGDGNLRIKPLRELQTLRRDPVVLREITIGDLTGEVLPAVAPVGTKIATLTSDAAEIRFTITREQASRKIFGFTLFADGQGGGLPIVFRPETGTLRVGTAEAPFAANDLAADEDLELRIFIDKYLVEVFANDRQTMVASHADYEGKPDLTAFTVGAPITISKVEIWNLNPTNQGFFEAQQDRIWQPDSE